uniref:precorrin-2 dehydrogenase n=1 Tax=Magnetococcus massalia (strain MO-1) TaxID=451514 RepID=A0A1S7LLI1_MAGMO|nr:putative precorrin-2 dehydrogenase [Candidatus Magnetococcus massalia]
MTHYMAELALTGQPVLVVGGGKVARRKLTGLLQTGARITVIAPQVCEAIKQLDQQEQIAWQMDHFSADLLDGQQPGQPHWRLVFAATGEAPLNRQIATLCAAKGLLCNSADGTTENGFHVPAMVRQGPITIGVATGGLSPALSRILKSRVEAALEPGWGGLVTLFGAMRDEVKRRLPQAQSRYTFWRQIALDAEAQQRFESTDNRNWFNKQLNAAEKGQEEH